MISASRRTDIPAFYSEWFMNRIRAGHVEWTNPFSGGRAQVSLRPEEVRAIVFWSKNYLPLLPHLDELEACGYSAVFQFTITGLPRVLEPGVPETSEVIACARTLASRAPGCVLWRYDPIVISEATDLQYHRDRFRELCAALEGVVTTCTFSFAIFYAKMLRKTQQLYADTGLRCHALPPEEQVTLANQLADIAAEHGIEMASCCGEGLVGGRIKKAHCVDAGLLEQLFPGKIGRLGLRPTRQECGCYESKDIGAYDTCPHGCVYCYAVAGCEAARQRYARHDPTAVSLA